MAEEWLVEVFVEGFGPSHGLWSQFSEQAKVYQEPSFRWEAHEAVGALSEAVLLRAVVEAPSPEAAIHRTIAIVRYVGRRLDRYGLIEWEGIRGSATRYLP